jgi:hypothetical protein
MHNFANQCTEDIQKVLYQAFYDKKTRNKAGHHPVDIILRSGSKGKTELLYPYFSHNHLFDPEAKAINTLLSMYQKKLNGSVPIMAKFTAEHGGRIDETRNSGTHFIFGNAGKSRNTWRISANISIKDFQNFIASFLEKLGTIECFACGIPFAGDFICKTCNAKPSFAFKVFPNPSSAESLFRRDKIVMYVEKNSYLMGKILAIFSSLKNYYVQDSPLFLKELVPGCSYGSNSPHSLQLTEAEQQYIRGESFGEKMASITTRIAHEEFKNHKNEMLPYFKSGKIEELFTYLVSKGVIRRIAQRVVSHRQITQYIKVMNEIDVELQSFGYRF